MRHPEKFHSERKEVARRIAKKLRRQPTKSVKLRWYERRYFRAYGYEGQMLNRLYERVSADVGRGIVMKVDHPLGQKLRSVTFTLREETDP